MICDTAQQLLSARVDGAIDDPGAVLDPQLDGHVDTCAACQAFASGMQRLRHDLRVQAVAERPDIASAVRRELQRREEERPRWSWRDRPAAAVAAATFVVAFAVGALSAGLVAPRPAVADDLGRRLLVAQAAVTSLVADVEVVEHGWHPDVPTRRSEGSLRYAAPEALVLELADATDYPSARWQRNDVTVVIDDATVWTRGLAPCPSTAQPSCTPEAPRTLAWRDLEPFTPVGPLPFDLIVPVTSFAPDGPAEPLGERRIDDRDALGVAVPAAQVAPLVDAVTATGNWRGVHPGDRAEVWLDADWLVPLEVVVRVAAGAERDRWAASHGYGDRPGDAILEIRLRSVVVNGDDPLPPPPTIPDDAVVRVGGFAPGPAPLVVPAWLPEGFTPHRSGVVSQPKSPEVEVATWTDGRAWIKVRATREWGQARLFGDVIGVVRRVDLGVAGTAYVGEGGATVAVHAAGLDVVVSGSVAPSELLRVAAGFGLEGVRVPTDWAEAATATLADAVEADPGLLVPVGLEGFGAPGVQVTGEVVVLGYAGAGNRALAIVQRPGTELAPPLAADVVGVEVRGTTGRYTPTRGELEWIEAGRVVALRSRTLGLGELLAIAAGLGAAS